MHWPKFLVFRGSKDIQGTVRLYPPGDVDLDKLAELTASSLKVLQPWCKAEHQSDALQKITVQAHTYTEAIHFSISAAQQGYNVANDALTLSEKANSKQKTEEELAEFAFSMLKLGQEAYTKAQECLNKFRNVRQVLTSLIEGARASDAHSVEHIAGKLTYLEEGIPLFEGLVANITTYITWWNWMELKTNATVESSKQLQVRYAAMRQKAVAAKWAELKEAFIQYREKVERLEDTYPELFGSFTESAHTPISAPDISSDYIKHHSENPRPKSSSKFGGFFDLVLFKSFVSHLRVRQHSVVA